MSELIELKILLFGTSSDAPLINDFKSNLKSDLEVVSLINLNFSELITQLSSCEIGIAGTTGQGHMLACADLPLLIISGVTNPAESGPYARRVAILKHSFLCGPCYQVKYAHGCGKIKCMETLDASEGARMAFKLIHDPHYGVDWIKKTNLRKTLSIDMINKNLGLCE